MKAYDKLGFLEFKQMVRSVNLEEHTKRCQNAEQLRELLEYVLIWLCELEDQYDQEVENEHEIRVSR